MIKACPEDVILQFVIEQIHAGHFERAIALGLGWEQIRFLEGLPSRDLHYLFNFAEHLISLQVGIDPAQAQIAIRRVAEQQRLRETQQALLRADTPRQLMLELYGWSATYYCDQRKLLGLEEDLPKGGRPRTPTPEEEAQILHGWGQSADRPLPERYLAVAQATGMTVRQLRRTLERRAPQAEEGLEVRLPPGGAAQAVLSAPSAVR